MLNNRQIHVISTDRLVNKDDLRNLVILDIRTEAEYEAGHIAGAITVPFEVPVSAWTTLQDELLLSLPKKERLFQVIGECGINEDAQVVIVTQGMDDPPYPLANATRVAVLLFYAGIQKVAVLDGGYAQWVAKKRPVTTDAAQTTAVRYQGYLDEGMFVSMDYLKDQIAKGQDDFILIDARATGVYDGSILESFADKAGHIPGARSMPAPLIWNADGTYKSENTLKEIAASVIREEDREIILYCGAGGYASAWWFVLTKILGYARVRIYNGSAQEWARHNEMVPS